MHERQDKKQTDEPYFDAKNRWPLHRFHYVNPSRVKKHRPCAQKHTHREPHHESKPPRGGSKQRHRFRGGFLSSDEGRQDQREKDHPADPADRRDEMKPDKNE